MLVKGIGPCERLDRSLARLFNRMLVPGWQGVAAVLGPVVVEAANSTDGTTVLEVQENHRQSFFFFRCLRLR